MAFPTTITTDGVATHGIAGPYVSSTGNVYVIICDDSRYDLRAMKATDPSDSFTNVGTDVVIGSGSDLIRSLAGWQTGDVIHVLTKNTNGSSFVDIRYHVFNMSSDTWTTTNDVIKSDMTTAAGGPGWLAQISICVRSDSCIIAIYNGALETVATVDYDRVYYARHIPGSGWSADFALGTAGVAASWVGGRAIPTSNNRVHFFMEDTTNIAVYNRCLNSAFALQTLPSPFDTSIFGWESIDQRGCYVTAGDAVALPYFEASNTLGRARIVTATDAPAVVVEGDITSAVAVLNSPVRYVASMAIDESTIWNTFIDTSNDIYTQSKPGATWENPTRFLVCSASAIYTTVFTRGAYRVLAMVYHDTDPKYHELTLSTSAAVAGGFANSLALLGCGG